MSDAQSSVTEPADFGPDEGAKARRWISELDLSQKDQKVWATRATKIIRKYKNERKDNDQRRFAILWSNMQTLQPAVYARVPQAVVSRRFKDSDPVGRVCSEILERALNYAVDSYDFDGVMKLSRDDYLLLARGQVWVRYEPHFHTVTPQIPVMLHTEAQDDGVSITDSVHIDAQGAQYGPDQVKHGDDGPYAEGEPYEAVEYEEVCCDHVAWDDFGTNPCRTWQEVRFVWRRAYLTREELRERFTADAPEQPGKTVGDLVPLDWIPKGTDEAKDDQFKKAAIYEIWDKATKTAVWVSKSYPNRLLDSREDPLGLEGFFPCPRPLLGTCGPDSLIPVPDYVYWQDQGAELDELTARIGKLTDALRLNGFYAGEHDTKLQNLFSAGKENTMIPVDSWAALKDSGGIKGIIEWFPIEMVVNALKACFETRQQIINDIYQITGIADILRGESDPNETATGVSTKAQWGSARVRDKQKELARFARDVLEIQGEIVAGKFAVETLKSMTGVQLLTNAEKQQVQAQIQSVTAMAQQAPQAQADPTGQAPPPQAPQPPQIPPELQRLLDSPTWEDVTALLQNKALRQFRIEIETDATIEPNDQEEKQRRVEFITALSQLIASSLPAVQAAPKVMPLVGEAMKFLARGFRVSREMEDIIDKVATDIGAMPPEPSPSQDPSTQIKQMVAQVQLQTAQIKAQAEQQRSQAEQQRSQADVAVQQGAAQVAAGDQHVKTQELAVRQQELAVRAHEINHPKPSGGAFQ